MVMNAASSHYYLLLVQQRHTESCFKMLYGQSDQLHGSSPPGCKPTQTLLDRQRTSKMFKGKLNALFFPISL